MIQTAIWIPPSLCGCKIKLTADFVDGSVKDGISYRHPVPFTITAIEAVSVCDEHQGQEMPETDSLMEIDRYTGQPYQLRGYLKHPTSGSPAECLYEYLSRFGGQVHRLPCGCAAFQFIPDRSNPIVPNNSLALAVSTQEAAVYVEHPDYSIKCFDHKDDDICMSTAVSDFACTQKGVQSIIDSLPKES